MKEWICKEEPLVHTDGATVGVGFRQMTELVRCKDCIHRGKAEKCVVAAISKEQDIPLFFLDNQGEWYCADGKRG